jgi:hypothetical protein
MTSDELVLNAVRVEDDRCRDVVIVALSLLSTDDSRNRGKMEQSARLAADNNDSGALYRFVCDNMGRFPWQQPLRAIYRHVDRPPGAAAVLPEIVVATSPETVRDFRDFKPILDGFLAPWIKLQSPDHERWRGEVVNWGTPIDFEEFENVTKRLHELIIEKKRQGRRSICIDITGGQKTFSAAATVVTVSEDTVISYVRTEYTPKPGVALYDVQATRLNRAVLISGGAI